MGADLSGITDELRRKILQAIADPGHFLKRGDDYTEPIPEWSARAVGQVLDEWLAGCTVVHLPEPDGVADDGGTYWTYPGGRVVVWPTGRFNEDRVARYRGMGLAMLAAAEFDEKTRGPGSGVGDPR